MTRSPAFEAVRKDAASLPPAYALEYLEACLDRGLITREECLELMNEPRPSLLVNTRGGSA